MRKINKRYRNGKPKKRYNITPNPYAKEVRVKKNLNEESKDNTIDNICKKTFDLWNSKESVNLAELEKKVNILFEEINKLSDESKTFSRLKNANCILKRILIKKKLEAATILKENLEMELVKNVLSHISIIYRQYFELLKSDNLSDLENLTKNFNILIGDVNNFPDKTNNSKLNDTIEICKSAFEEVKDSVEKYNFDYYNNLKRCQNNLIPKTEITTGELNTPFEEFIKYEGTVVNPSIGIFNNYKPGGYSTWVSIIEEDDDENKWLEYCSKNMESRIQKYIIRVYFLTISFEEWLKNNEADYKNYVLLFKNVEEIKLFIHFYPQLARKDFFKKDIPDYCKLKKLFAGVGMENRCWDVPSAMIWNHESITNVNETKLNSYNDEICRYETVPMPNKSEISKLAETEDDVYKWINENRPINKGFDNHGFNRFLNVIFHELENGRSVFNDDDDIKIPKVNLTNELKTEIRHHFICKFICYWFDKKYNKSEKILDFINNNLDISQNKSDADKVNDYLNLILDEIESFDDFTIYLSEITDNVRKVLSDHVKLKFPDIYANMS